MMRPFEYDKINEKTDYKLEMYMDNTAEEEGVEYKSVDERVSKNLDVWSKLQYLELSIINRGEKNKRYETESLRTSYLKEVPCYYDIESGKWTEEVEDECVAENMEEVVGNEENLLEDDQEDESGMICSAITPQRVPIEDFVDTNSTKRGNRIIRLVKDSLIHLDYSAIFEDCKNGSKDESATWNKFIDIVKRIFKAEGYDMVFERTMRNGRVLCCRHHKVKRVDV